MSEPKYFTDFQNVIDRLNRALEKGTGIRISAGEVHSLSLTGIGQWMGQERPEFSEMVSRDQPQ